jgi:hypothetical protein
MASSHEEPRYPAGADLMRLVKDVKALSASPRFAEALSILKGCGYNREVQTIRDIVEHVAAET